MKIDFVQFMKLVNKMKERKKDNYLERVFPKEKIDFIEARSSDNQEIEKVEDSFTRKKDLQKRI